MEQEYVVCSALSVVPFAKPTIEAIIQRRSRIESHANLLLTLVLLRWYESGKPFTEEVVNQTTVNACARAVCSRVVGGTPKPVKFKKPEYQDVQSAVRAAQSILLPTMLTFENDTGLTELINQSSRSYVTVLTNNVFMRIEAWQIRTLRAELLRPGSPRADSSRPMLSFLCKAAARAINMAKPLDPTNLQVL